MPAPVVRSQTNRNHTPARPCLSKKEVIRSKLQVHRRTCNRILGRDEMDVSGLGSTRRRERSEIAAEGLTPNQRARSHQAGKFTKLASAYFFATHFPPPNTTCRSIWTVTAGPGDGPDDNLAAARQGPRLVRLH